MAEVLSIPTQDQVAAVLTADWVPVIALDELVERGRKVVKVGRKQIALFHSEQGLFACNNRCPHEGYPLVEGSLTTAPQSGNCLLTCNWHNWKFDLESGETLTGGDKLRRYPVRVEKGQVLIDVSDPPGVERAAEALANLKDSFRRQEYDRMAREIARLQAAGSDPLEALRGAIAWTHDRLEFGTTHAHAAAPDWLALRDLSGGDEATRLVPILEAVANLSYDSLREPRFAYAEGRAPYDAEALVAAIDREDEAAALAQLRGALAEGRAARDLEGPLASAALAHYQDFGHSAIYLQKTLELIDRLGPSVAEPLLLALVRALIYAWREDLIPEFRDYADSLAAWDGQGDAPVAAADFIDLNAGRAMARALRSSGNRQALYDALLGAAAWNWLHFDLAVETRTDGPVSDNKSWLSFTHAVTFANAVRHLCSRHPALWPAGLLQMACFVGRNAGYTDAAIEESGWRVECPEEFLEDSLRGLLDHGQSEYILVAHLVKTVTAVRDEVLASPDAPWVPSLVAATNRFLNSPVKRRHPLRTARQSLAFVALEG